MFALTYNHLIRPLLFRLNPEKAHDLTLSWLNWMPEFLFPKVEGREVEALGLRFAHPLGLAAGLDKNGDYLTGLDKLGFSFLEIGTVTPLAQVGNPKPRLFRLESEQALINRMGFNNLGVDHLVKQVKKTSVKAILGINLGKNKDTPLLKAVDDYCLGLAKVYPYADYVTINISSPNTPELRQLQQGEYLVDLLGKLVEYRQGLMDRQGKKVPLVVKVSPDENEETLKTIADTLLNLGIEGLIACNTTCDRTMVSKAIHAQETGGLSGKPLFASSTACLRLLKSLAGNDLTLIGVGGIHDLQSAQEKIEAGADLIQLYTGLIYQGPGLIRDIVAGL